MVVLSAQPIYLGVKCLSDFLSARACLSTLSTLYDWFMSSASGMLAQRLAIDCILLVNFGDEPRHTSLITNKVERVDFHMLCSTKMSRYFKL